MSPLKAIAAAAVVLAAAQAHAISFTVTDGAFSNADGALTDTFDVVAPGPGLISLSPGGGTFHTGATIPGVSAKPPGSTGRWWSIAGTTDAPGEGIVNLNAPATYYGFLWGSPDKYNTVSFLLTNGTVQSFKGDEVFVEPPANGDQGAFVGGQYVNFSAGEGEAFSQVTFSSAGIAFETDNHSVVFEPTFQVEGFTAAVPEPETYALMLAGLCAIGLMLRNRRPD